MTGDSDTVIVGIEEGRCPVDLAVSRTARLQALLFSDS